MSPVTSILAKKFNNKSIIVVAIFFLAVANLFIGGLEFLRIPQALWTTCVGMAILGIATNAIFVTMMPEIISQTMKKVGK